MAPRIIGPTTVGLLKLKTEFEQAGRDVPCMYCEKVPTQPIAIVPHEIIGGRIVKREHRADICWACMRRLGISRSDRAYAERKAQGIKQSRKWAREDARSEMRANQLSMLGDLDAPTSPLLKGKDD